MNKNVLFFGATVLIVAIQALFVMAGAIDLAMRQSWPVTAMAMLAIGTMFAFANRHEMRVGRFIAVPVTIALLLGIGVVSIAWNGVAIHEKGYWIGIEMISPSLLPIVTVFFSWITFFGWYDWGFDQLLLKPEKTCSRCNRKIPVCVSDDAKFCLYCGQNLEVRHG